MLISSKNINIYNKSKVLILLVAGSGIEPLTSGL